MFSSAGIAETYFKDIGLNTIVANELLIKRANLYSNLNPDTIVINGDITNKNIKNKILDNSNNINYLIATPPCQGVSRAGKNHNLSDMINDERNYLIFHVIEIIHKKKPDYILIENVPRFLDLLLPYKNKLLPIKDILTKEFSTCYNIEIEILDSSDFGVAQKRLRSIIKLYKKNLTWVWPTRNEKKISVYEAISYLPSLESNQKSDIPWHYARKHTEKHILWMKNTPTGKSAFENEIYYPKKENGEKIKGYKATYARMSWDEPAPTITMRNDAISSQRNVHPGRKLNDGTFSDARVLTPLELMILTSLPSNWNIPKDTPEILIRQCLGECVPPLLIKKIMNDIG